MISPQPVSLQGQSPDQLEIIRKIKGRIDWFFSIIGCLFIVAAVFTLGGCISAVPYAISAAQVATTALPSQAQSGGTSSKTASIDNAAARQEEGRPYQLIADKKYDEAVPLLRDRADRDDAKAQGQLAMLYLEGKGVPENTSKAAEWLKKSAEGGYAHSQYMLAWFYYKGTGVARDYSKAFEWAQKSNEQGNSDAAILLAQLYRMGLGVHRDYHKALELYNKADVSGNIHAPAHIAYMYKTGQGVTRDYHQAIDWYSKAGEKGNTNGWIHLAYLYATCQDSQYVDGRKAVVYGLKATEKDPGNFASWAALAAAYARNNEFEKAIGAAIKSDGMLKAYAEIDDDKQRDAMNRAQARLVAYKESKAYTEENEADEEN